VHNFAFGDGAHFVERFAVCIAVHGPDIDSFMKAGVNDAARSVFGITHKPVFAALPRRRFYSVVVTLDVLVKCRAVSRKKSVVVGWENKIEAVILGGLNCYRT
jgi:hypothetical protein